MTIFVKLMYEALCKYCNTLLSYKNNNVKNLQRHMKNKFH